METWWINDKVTEDWIALLFRKRSVTCFSPWQFLQLYPSVFDLRFEFRPLRSHYNRLHYCSPVLLTLSLPKAVFDRFYPRPFLVSSADLSPFFRSDGFWEAERWGPGSVQEEKLEGENFYFPFLYFLFSTFPLPWLLLLLLIYSLPSSFFFIVFLISISLHFMFMFGKRKCKVAH